MKVGEPITYVDFVSAGWAPRGGEHFRKGLVCSHIAEVLSYSVFLVEKNGSPFLGGEDEHIRWVYGHHTERSETGKALLAAYALSRGLAA